MMAVVTRLIRNKLFQNSAFRSNSVHSSWSLAKITSTDVESRSKKDVKPQLIISDNCIKQLMEVADSSTHLRISVEGGGCSGFQYKFELDQKINEDDVVFQKGGMKIVVDETSLELIKGATVDYHRELIRASFRITNNPQAEQGCSCGASFNIRIT